MHTGSGDETSTASSRTARTLAASEGPRVTGQPEVEVLALEKSFGDVRAVDGVSFSVSAGETYGLLGPNGAGKTTLMRILAGLSPPTGGHARVTGLDVREQPRAVRYRMGVVTQADGLDTELSVKQNLEVFGYLAGLSSAAARSRADEVLEFFSLATRSDDRVDTLSGGLRRRLAIARALVNQPRVIVLDEPTTGLDPESRVTVWEELAALKRQGVTVLMTTHYMEEAETLCDRIGILHTGKMLDEASPPALIERHAGGRVTEIRPASGDEASRQLVRSALAAAGVSFREVGALFRLNGTAPAALPALPEARIEERAPNLEDVFLTLAGRGLGDE